MRRGGLSKALGVDKNLGSYVRTSVGTKPVALLVKTLEATPSGQVLSRGFLLKKGLLTAPASPLKIKFLIPSYIIYLIKILPLQDNE